MPTDFLSVLELLERAQIRYVLVGGLAVLMHGVDRLTADIDLVIDLAPVEASRAVDTLLGAGFKAAAPVDPRLFADPGIRNRWKTDSGMLVLSFWDPAHRRPTVDIFCEYPMDFETLYRDSRVMPLTGSQVRVASVDHLIAIKGAAGRPKDLEDAARLAEMAGRGGR